MTLSHDILGVAADAEPAEIRRAYLRLAGTMHPDAGGCVEAFRRIQTAYETLLEATPAASATGAPNAEEKGAQWKSYADIMEEARQQLDLDESAWRETESPRQQRTVAEGGGSVGLTVLASAIVASVSCLSLDGIDAAAWSFVFCVTLAVLVQVCGLAAFLASAPGKSVGPTYRRLVIVALCVALLIVPYASPDAIDGSSLNEPATIVPKWWPLQPRTVDSPSSPLHAWPDPWPARRPSSPDGAR